MWFINRFVNPVMIFLLRSRWHGFASASVLLISYTGRKSGKEHTLPVQYVRQGSRIYILPGTPERKVWWKNLRGGLPVRVALHSRTIPGHGLVLETEESLPGKLTALSLFLERYPRLAKMMKLQPDPDGTYNQVDLRRAAGKMVVVAIDLEQDLAVGL